MRTLVRDYVHAVHSTYLDHVGYLPPAERARLPLLTAKNITVIAAAARHLHLIATTDPLPAPQGNEVLEHDQYEQITWSLRFYDPSILPALGLLAPDPPEDVRRAIGVTSALYHLTIEAGGGLDAHHAQHTGVALANRHSKVSRDLDRLRHALPQKIALIEEFGACVRNDLPHAAALLAKELSNPGYVPDSGTDAAATLDWLLSSDLLGGRR